MKSIYFLVVAFVLIVAVNVWAADRDKKRMQINYCHTTNDMGEVVAWQC